MISSSQARKDKAEKLRQPRIERVPDGPPVDFSNKSLECMEDLEKLKVKAFEANIPKANKTHSDGPNIIRGTLDPKEAQANAEALKKGDRKDEHEANKHEKAHDHGKHGYGQPKENVSLVPKNHLDNIISNNDIALTNVAVYSGLSDYARSKDR